MNKIQKQLLALILIIGWGMFLWRVFPATWRIVFEEAQALGPGAIYAKAFALLFSLTWIGCLFGLLFLARWSRLGLLIVSIITLIGEAWAFFSTLEQFHGTAPISTLWPSLRLLLLLAIWCFVAYLVMWRTSLSRCFSMQPIFPDRS